MSTSANYDINAKITYNNPCGTPKSGKFKFTYYVNGSPRTHEFTHNIPSGNSWFPYTYNTDVAYTNASASCVTCSGPC